jgi:hypothetical protein
MTTRSHVLMTLVGAMAAWVAVASAQPASDPVALRREANQRFDVLPLRDGIMLQPRIRNRTGIRSIEVASGGVAVDGVTVTGGELRDRLAGDTDLVLRISYLDAEGRRRFLAEEAEHAATPAPPVTPESPDSDNADGQRRSRRDRDRDWNFDTGNDRVHIGGSVGVAADENIKGDVVAVGGSAHVEGAVDGSVVAIGGSVDLGPHARVDRDVIVIGGTLHRDPAAVIKGDVKEIGIGAMSGIWTAPFGVMGRWNRRVWAPSFALASTISYLVILLLLCVVVVLFGAGYVERVGARAAAEPLKAGAIGFLAQLLFIPLLVITVVVLVATLIGIPLLVLVPFAVIGLGVVGLVGFTGVASRVGARVALQLGFTQSSEYFRTILGVIALLAPILAARFLSLLFGGLPFIGGGLLAFLSGTLGFVGFCLEYVAWTIGFGAVALVRFQNRRAPAFGGTTG